MSTAFSRKNRANWPRFQIDNQFRYPEVRASQRGFAGADNTGEASQSKRLTKGKTMANLRSSRALSKGVTCYAVRITSADDDTWETVLGNASEAEARAYANAYNLTSWRKTACVFSYPAGSEFEAVFESALPQTELPDPTPAEIRRSALEIQARWDDTTRLKRFHKLESENGKRSHWTPPLIDELLLLTIDGD
jgi:hypothetical protein